MKISVFTKFVALVYGAVSTLSNGTNSTEDNINTNYLRRSTLKDHDDEIYHMDNRLLQDNLADITCSLDTLAILNDNSGSLGEAYNNGINVKNEHLIPFEIETIKLMHDINPIGTNNDELRIGLYEFSDNPRTIVSFSNKRSGSKSALISKLNEQLSNPPIGGTYCSAAMEMLYDELTTQDMINKIKVILFVTDGSCSDPSAAAYSMRKIREKGIKIISVGLGENLDADFLKKNSDSYIPVDKIELLPTKIGNILKISCRTESPTIAPTVAQTRDPEQCNSIISLKSGDPCGPYAEEALHAYPGVENQNSISGTIIHTTVEKTPYTKFRFETSNGYQEIAIGGKNVDPTVPFEKVQIPNGSKYHITFHDQTTVELVITDNNGQLQKDIILKSSSGNFTGFVERAGNRKMARDEDILCNNVGYIFTDSPSVAPSASPSEAPSASPSEAPSASPSEAPSASPSEAPSASPSEAPSASPSEAPSASPTNSPTEEVEPAVVIITAAAVASAGYTAFLLLLPFYRTKTIEVKKVFEGKVKNNPKNQKPKTWNRELKVDNTVPTLQQKQYGVSLFTGGGVVSHVQVSKTKQVTGHTIETLSTSKKFTEEKQAELEERQKTHTTAAAERQERIANIEYELVSNSTEVFGPDIPMDEEQLSKGCCSSFGKWCCTLGCGKFERGVFHSVKTKKEEKIVNGVPMMYVTETHTYRRPTTLGLEMLKIAYDQIIKCNARNKKDKKPRSNVLTPMSSSNNFINESALQAVRLKPAVIKPQRETTSKTMSMSTLQQALAARQEQMISSRTILKSEYGSARSSSKQESDGDEKDKKQIKRTPPRLPSKEERNRKRLATNQRKGTTTVNTHVLRKPTPENVQVQVRSNRVNEKNDSEDKYKSQRRKL